MGKYALIVVLSMVFALMVYGSGLQDNLRLAQEEMVSDFNTAQAGNIANSVALVAVRKLRDPADDSFTPEAGSTLYYPGANQYAAWDEMKGKYNIEVYNQGDSVVTLTTTARVDDATYQTELKMFSSGSEWNPNLPFAVFARSGITLKGSASIIGHGGTNATNANAVDFTWATSIDSSLSIGPGGDPNTVVHQANFINGNVGLSIGNLPTPLDYPLPNFPEFPPVTMLGSSVDVPYGSSTISSSSYDGTYIPQLRLRGNSTLTLDTGGQDRVLHVGDLDIKQGHLKFTGGGKVTIYVEDELNLNGSSTLNDNGNQSNVFVYHAGSQDIDIAGATNFNSGIYTKNSDITITGSGGIQGNIITGGDDVTISGDADVNSRLVYAPEADVVVTGSGISRGAVVAESFLATGNGKVVYSQNLDSELPDLEGEKDNYRIAYWK